MFSRVATSVCRTASARIAQKTTPKILAVPTTNYSAVSATSTNLWQNGGCRHKSYAPVVDKSIPISLCRSNGETRRVNIKLYGEDISYDHLFLRDSCPCPSCINPSTQQKTFATTDLPLDTKPFSLELANKNRTLKVKWNGEDGHVSEYPVEWLVRYSSKKNRSNARFNSLRQKVWDKEMMEQQVKWIDYEAYMNDDEALLDALKTLQHSGLVFLRGVPTEVDSVATVAKRIGPLKNTFYGETWDVKSVANAKNVAYTKDFLGLHMDLCYFQSPPGIQLLHCMKNDATGGSSIFSDSFRAAYALKTTKPEYFSSLTKFPVTFHYKNDGQHYHYSRPMIVMAEDGMGTSIHDKKIDHVNWSPPFQAPFEEGCEDTIGGQWRLWFRAAKHFAGEVEHPDNVFELTLREGECVLFANRRVLHGRREFDPSSGDRWLRGTYLDIDAYRSKLRVLCEQFYGSDGSGADKQPIRKSGYEHI